MSGTANVCAIFGVVRGSRCHFSMHVQIRIPSKNIGLIFRAMLTKTKWEQTLFLWYAAAAAAAVAAVLLHAIEKERASLIFFSASYGLPFGTADLYFRKEDDGTIGDCLDPSYGKRRKGEDARIREPKLVPIKRDLLDQTAGNFDREESIFAQFMSEVCYPGALGVNSAFHAGEGQLPLGRSKWKADLTLLLANAPTPFAEGASKSGRTLLFANYHGFFHNDQNCKGGHEKGCCKFTGTELEFNQKTIEQDKTMKAYAEEMSKVIEGLTFRYITMTPCQFFHGNALPNAPGHTDARAFLRDRHPESTILGRLFRNGIGESALLKEILAEKATGFVTIEGGRESFDDNASRMFAFCHTRGSQNLDELGSEAIRLAKERSAGKSETEIKEGLRKKLSSSQVTYTRKHFEGPHTMTTQFFNFLVKKRGFKDFKIVHFIHYEIRKYLASWVISMLQHRWAIKKGFYTGERGCSELALKIILNALYGYRYCFPLRFLPANSRVYPPFLFFLSMIEGKNYPDAKVVREDGLKPHPDKPVKDYPILLGVVKGRKKKRGQKSSAASSAATFHQPRGKGRGIKKKEKPCALYLIERSKPLDRIRNLIQSSVAILNNSRALFYDQILRLLNSCKLDAIEPAYTDTG